MINPFRSRRWQINSPSLIYQDQNLVACVESVSGYFLRKSCFKSKFSNLIFWILSYQFNPTSKVVLGLIFRGGGLRICPMSILLDLTRKNYVGRKRFISRPEGHKFFYIFSSTLKQMSHRLKSFLDIVCQILISALKGKIKSDILCNFLNHL